MKPNGNPWLERAAWILLWLLVFSLPFEKAIQFPWLGTISRLTGQAAFVAGAAAVASRRRLRLPNAALLLAVALVLWEGLSWVWSMARQDTLVRFLTMAQLLGMAWLIWEICRTPARQLRLIQAFVLGAVVSSAWTFARAAQNQQTYWRRFATAGFDPNDLGITLALALTLALYLSFRTRGWQAWAARIASVLFIEAILLTASRAALVASLMNFVLLVLLWRRSTVVQKLSGAAILLLLALGPVKFAPPASRERLATLPAEATTGTLHDRTRIWKAGLRLFRKRPVAGIGFGAYPEAAYPELRIHYNAHNTYLSVLVETGAIGFLIFTALLIVLLWFVWLLDSSQRALWLTALAVWGMGVLTVTWEHRKPTWLIFALIMTAWSRSFQAREAEPEAPAAALSGAERKP